MPTTCEDLHAVMTHPAFTEKFPDFESDNFAHILTGLVWLHQRSTSNMPSVVVTTHEHIFDILQYFTPTDLALAVLAGQLVDAEKVRDERVIELVECLEAPLSNGMRVTFNTNHEITGYKFPEFVTGCILVLRETVPEEASRRSEPPHIYVE